MRGGLGSRAKLPIFPVPRAYDEELLEENASRRARRSSSTSLPGARRRCGKETHTRQSKTADGLAHAQWAVPEDKLAIAPVPAGPEGRFTFLGGSVLALFKSSKHTEEAVALLRHLSSEAAQLQYSMVTGGLVAAAGEYDELLLQLDPFRRAFVALMKYGRAYPSIPVWGEIEVVLRDGLNALWAKATGPEAYDRAATRRQLQDMQRKIDGILRRRARRAAK